MIINAHGIHILCRICLFTHSICVDSEKKDTCGVNAQIYRFWKDLDHKCVRCEQTINAFAGGVW